MCWWCCWWWCVWVFWVSGVLVECGVPGDGQLLRVGLAQQRGGHGAGERGGAALRHGPAGQGQGWGRGPLAPRTRGGGGGQPAAAAAAAVVLGGRRRRPVPFLPAHCPSSSRRSRQQQQQQRTVHASEVRPPSPRWACPCCPFLSLSLPADVLLLGPLCWLLLFCLSVCRQGPSSSSSPARQAPPLPPSSDTSPSSSSSPGPRPLQPAALAHATPPRPLPPSSLSPARQQQQPTPFPSCSAPDPSSSSPVEGDGAAAPQYPQSFLQVGR